MSDAATGTERSAEDVQGLTNDYLEAFDARDLDRCLRFFDDSSVIEFQMGVYKGLQSIEGWHKDRFAANLRLVDLESMEADGPVVTVDAIAASNRLAAWGVKSVAGRLTITFDGGLIRHAKLAARMNNPINSIRSGLGLGR